MAVNTIKNQSWVRRSIQVGFFLFIFMMVLSHFLESNGSELRWSAPHLHAVCPFGAVETTGRLITQGQFIPKTHESNFWVLLATTGATLLIGAAFCGWLCPLGSVQDWIGRLGKKISGKRFNRVPYILDQMLGYLRYVVLALVVISTTRMISLVFVSVDPYYALFHFWTGEALPSAIAVLAVVLLASLVVERPWCRWLCPFGALQGILQLVSPWKIRRNPEICINCDKWTRACPMRIKVSEKKFVLDTRCNRCGECLAVCPIKGGLEHSLPGKIRIPLKNRLLTAFLVLALFSAPIVISQQAGLFKTTNKVVVVEGTLKAEEIKSSMTLEELATGFNVSLDTLIAFLSLPESVPGSTKLRDLEDIDDSMTTKAVRSKMSTFG